MKTFERELPENYTLVKTVDANGKKLGILLNLIAVLVTAGIAVGGYFLFRPKFRGLGIYRPLIFAAVVLAYIVLHELTHGLAYKLLTKQKLTFGMTLTVAFCGVPEIYVYRRPALVALLAPFTVFTLVFGALTIFLPNPIDQFLSCIALGLHLGGCSGDLYVTGLLTFKLRGKVLIQDTGPKQTFYIEESK